MIRKFITVVARQDTFRIESGKHIDAWKIRLLMHESGNNEHVRYANHILPGLPQELSFQETVAQLSEIFSESPSLFSI